MSDIVYAPMILKSIEEIRKVFGVSVAQIKRWVEDGAPIVVEGFGRRTRYSTEAMRLQSWREQQKNPH